MASLFQPLSHRVLKRGRKLRFVELSTSHMTLHVGDQPDRYYLPRYGTYTAII